MHPRSIIFPAGTYVFRLVMSLRQFTLPIYVALKPRPASRTRDFKPKHTFYKPNQLFRGLFQVILWLLAGAVFSGLLAFYFNQLFIQTIR